MKLFRRAFLCAVHVQFRPTPLFLFFALLPVLTNAAGVAEQVNDNKRVLDDASMSLAKKQYRFKAIDPLVLSQDFPIVLIERERTGELGRKLVIMSSHFKRKLLERSIKEKNLVRLIKNDDAGKETEHYCLLNFPSDALIWFEFLTQCTGSTVMTSFHLNQFLDQYRKELNECAQLPVRVCALKATFLHEAFKLIYRLYALNNLLVPASWEKYLLYHALAYSYSLKGAREGFVPQHADCVAFIRNFKPQDVGTIEKMAASVSSLSAECADFYLRLIGQELVMLDVMRDTMAPDTTEQIKWFLRCLSILNFSDEKKQAGIHFAHLVGQMSTDNTQCFYKRVETAHIRSLLKRDQEEQEQFRLHNEKHKELLKKYADRVLNEQLHQMPIQKRKKALALLANRACEQSEVHMTSVLDEQSRTDLLLLFGPRSREECSFASLFPLQTEMGRALLIDYVINPTNDKRLLDTRQKIIQTVENAQNDAIKAMKDLLAGFVACEAENKLLSSLENAVFSFLDAEDPYLQFIEYIEILSPSSMPNESLAHLVEMMNNNEVAIEITNELPQLGFTIVRKGAQNAVTWVKMKVADNWIMRSLLAEGNTNRAAALLKNALTSSLKLAQSGIVMVKENVNALSTVVAITFPSIAPYVLTLIPFIHLLDPDSSTDTARLNLQKKLMLLSQFFELSRKLYALIQENEPLKSLLAYEPDLERLNVSAEKAADIHESIWRGLDLSAQWVCNKATLVKNLFTSTPQNAPEEPMQENNSWDAFVGRINSSTFSGEPSTLSFMGRVITCYKELKAQQREISQVLYAVGLLDFYVTLAEIMKKSAAAAAVVAPDSKKVAFCYPSYVRAGTPRIAIHDFWNPLLYPNHKEPSLADMSASVSHQVVTNSLQIGGEAAQNCIVTGPSAGGKSTTVRGLALAVIMAQSLGIAPARSLSLTPFGAIRSYMNIVDDSVNGDSLFMAGGRRTLELSKFVRERMFGQFSLTLFDELLNGTNNRAGQAAAYAIVEDMLQSAENIAIITTHFEKLSALQDAHPRLVANYQMEVVQLPDGQTRSKYKLIPGIYVPRPDETFKILKMLASDFTYEEEMNALMTKARSIVEQWR